MSLNSNSGGVYYAIDHNTLSEKDFGDTQEIDSTISEHIAFIDNILHGHIFWKGCQNIFLQY